MDSLFFKSFFIRFLGYFDSFRRSFLLQKIGNLYKGVVDNSIFGGLYFIPLDIVDAIVSLDISDFLDEGKIFRKELLE